ncbi:MAG: transporter, partial [Treponema sp.]|nr:transporter [Treponema sp.]
GILGFLLREMDYPMAPLVLGIILGDILDKNLRRALIISDGSLTPFFTRPICLLLFAATVLIIVSRLPVTARIRQAILAKRKGAKAA